MNPNNLRKKLVGSEEERAVSPVIGVILMVAITVILAAVIAAFVLDIGPGQSSVNAAVDISGDGSDEVTIQVRDSGDADEIAVVNDDGEIVDTAAANAGAEYEASSGSSDFDLDGEGDEFTIFAIRGSATDNVDEAEASTQINTFSYDGN